MRARPRRLTYRNVTKPGSGLKDQIPRTPKVRGRVTVVGDPPPVLPGTLPPTARCGNEARETYEKLFRVGRGGELADAFVGVTDYKAFVPATGPVVPLTIRGCAFDRRTVALVQEIVLTEDLNRAVARPVHADLRPRKQSVSNLEPNLRAPIDPERIGQEVAEVALAERSGKAVRHPERPLAVGHAQRRW